MKSASLFVLCVCLAAPGWAQDAESPPEKPKTDNVTPDTLPDDAAPPAPRGPDAQALLLRALDRLKTARSVVARAEIKSGGSDAQAGGAGGFGGGKVVIMRTNFSSSAAPFSGRVDIWRAPDGILIVTSEKTIPGFDLFAGPERTIVRKTVEDEDFDLAQIRAELAPLFDTERWAGFVLGAKLRSKWDSERKEMTFSGELAKDVVKPVRNQNPMSPRVLKVETRFQIAENGGFRRLELTVTRNDPAREMMGGRVGFAVRLGPNGKPQVVPQKQDGEKHDIEGAKTTYAVTFERGDPSARAREFKATIAQALEGE